MFVKVDFEKAYDTVLWEYLDEIMACMNFSETWRKWIQGCLSSAHTSVLVNGSPSGEFALQRGLRQGDPLSPFLFLIAAKGMRAIMRKAESLQCFEGVEVGREKVKVTHLQFADDTILMGKASESNARTLKGMLRLFELASGLKVNYSKSSLVGLHIDSSKCNQLANIVGCKIRKFPISYLGLPIGANHRRKECWQPLIDRFRKKLSV